MVYGLIICAGKQSRFKSETPKALVNIDGETLLEKNMKAMKPFCDRICVVCSYENERFFKDVDKITIHSGKGSGDAVWQALERLDIQKGDSCFILWGDSLQTKDIYKLLTQKYNGRALIPCVFEENPYVQVSQKGKGLDIKFSKFKEPITAGYHDLSIFYCEAYDLLLNLRNFRSQILDKNDSEKYVHKHGNEMEFLDVFNETNIQADVVEVKHYKDFSFNTIEQFQSLANEIKSK